MYPPKVQGALRSQFLPMKNSQSLLDKQISFKTFQHHLTSSNWVAKHGKMLYSTMLDGVEWKC